MSAQLLYALVFGRGEGSGELPVDPASIDAVVLTHAHLDHSGYLPLLARNGFKRRILCTAATADLCEILLPDAGHLAGVAVVERETR